MDVPTREPEIFASGDSLVFKRYLPGFLPSDGWSLHYTVTAGDGALLAAVTSTAADAFHAIDEDAFLVELGGREFPIQAVLAGFAVNGDARHQVYYGGLTVTANLGDSTDDSSVTVAEPVLTEAQQMLNTIRASLLDAYKVVYQEVNLSGSKVVWANIMQLRQELAYWKEVRRNEIAMERARAGRPTGLLTVPVFQIG